MITYCFFFGLVNSLPFFTYHNCILWFPCDKWIKMTINFKLDNKMWNVNWSISQACDKELNPWPPCVWEVMSSIPGGGLRVFLCPTLTSRWSIHLSHYDFHVPLLWICFTRKEYPPLLPFLLHFLLWCTHHATTTIIMTNTMAPPVDATMIIQRSFFSPLPSSEKSTNNH